MRKHICSVIWAISFLPAFADGYDYLWLQTSSDTSPNSYALDNVQKITFGAETLNLHLLNQSSPLAVDYGSSIKITFENAPTAVKDVAVNSGISMCYDTNKATVSVESSVPIKVILVYNAHGVCVASFGQSELSAETSLGSLPAGIYIVRADNGQEIKTIKIIKH